MLRAVKSPIKTLQSQRMRNDVRKVGALEGDSQSALIYNKNNF